MARINCMDKTAVLVRIRELEDELDSLREQLAQVNSGPSFKDLRDSLSGKFEVTDELIEECEVRIDWDKLLPETQA